MRRSIARVTTMLVAALLLVACGGDDRAVEWRDARLQTPDGWVVFDDEETRLSVANVPLGPLLEEQGVQPEGDVVAMFFTHEPGATPTDWRDYAAANDVVIERDEAIEVGGVPATRFHLRDPEGGSGQTLTRELVVVIPSREVVLLAQPVPALGDDDVTGVFDRHLAAFDQVLDSLTWGAPVGGPGTDSD